MDAWLLRTSQNVITGPYTIAEIREKALSGDLALQDELCPASGYWFYLHESEEVFKQLGIQMPRQSDDGESTQTEMARDAEKTDPELPNGGGAGNTGASPSPGGSDDAQPSLLEPPSLWQGLIWVLLLGLVAVALAVLRLSNPGS